MVPVDNIALFISPEGHSASAVPDAPRLSQARIELLREVPVFDERGSQESIRVPWERPLTIVLDDREIVTLMTLGASPEWLTLGHLRNQRIVDSVSAIESIEVDWRAGRAYVKSRVATGPAARTAGMPVKGASTASQLDVLQILETMRHHDAVHKAAGSVHSCALFRGGSLLVAVEDISRHNGIDTVTGWMSYHAIGGSDKILFTTGRLTAEMVLRAAFNGIPMMVSRNGTTALGIELAEKLGMALLGRAARGRFLCFTGATRFSAG